MIKAVITDDNIQSRELLVNHFKNIPNVEIAGVFDSLYSINFDLKSVDLILFDINKENSDKILNEIKIIKNKYNKNINFIALSYEADSKLVVKTLKAGADEFLLKPIILSILEAAITKIENIKNNNGQNFSKTICVFSNKGGVGKTTLAVNLAYEISKLENNKVCLLDLSFNNEDVSTFLNMTPKYKADYILDHIETSDVKTLLSLMNRYKESNLYILSLQENMQFNIKFTPHLISKVINSLKNVFSKIIIDTSSSINETFSAIINDSDLVLLVGMMNLSSIKSCQKCFELFDNMGYNSDKIKLIINRFIQNPDLTIEEVEKTIGKEVFGKIPNNYLTLVDAINSGLTVAESNPQSNIAKAYKNIANLIEDMDFEDLKDKTQHNHGILNLIKRIGD